MTQKHDYGAADEWLDKYVKDTFNFGIEGHKHLEAIRHALKIAKRVMGEPTPAMISLSVDLATYDMRPIETFRALVEHIVEEVDGEN